MSSGIAVAGIALRRITTVCEAPRTQANDCYPGYLPQALRNSPQECSSVVSVAVALPDGATIDPSDVPTLQGEIAPSLGARGALGVHLELRR